MLKKFLIGTFAVLALAVAVQVYAAVDLGPTTLVKGSSGQYVMNLQTIVGVTADGKFGAMTEAAVKAWQASHGLTADGKVGPATKAAMGGAVVTTPVAGCAAGALFNSMTGAPCTVATLPAGCVAGAMFSSTTGVACTATATPTGLTGGAGDITVTELSTPSSSTKVGEGESNIKVYGVELEADDNSDLAVTSMKIELVNGGTGSKKLSRYAKSVSVWYNGKEVGSADASEFSESSNIYTKSISLSGVVVKAGEKAKVYVAVSAIDDIDSGNVSSTYNTWTVELISLRYQDASGAVMTESTGTTGSGTGSYINTFIFDSLASTQDVELKVNLASDTPVSSTVKVSTTSDTNQVPVLKFTMKAQGSDMVIDQIPVYFDTSETDLDQVTSNVTLVIDGQTFNESVSTSATDTATILFDNLNLSVDAGATLTGVVYADIQDIESSTFDEGTNIVASITSTLVTAVSGNYIDVEDSNGDQLATGDRTGSAMGNTITFRSTGVNVDMGTVTYDKTTDTNGNITSVKYIIPVAVTSFGNTLYMGQTAQLAETATASNAFALVFENASAPTTAVTSSMTNSITLSTSNATIETNGFRLDDGLTKNFTLTVNLTDPAVYSASYRVRLDDIRTFTEAGLVTGTSSDLLPQVDFRTDYQLINS